MKRLHAKIHRIYNNFRALILRTIFKDLKPISNIYGFDRGIPLDRFYIEAFLAENRDKIKGHCLEVLDNAYTKIYGGKKVEKSDVLDIDSANKNANIVGDLRNLKGVADNTYDCIILTQVLQFIDDYEKAIVECKRILKPTGTLLATLPSLSRIDVAAGVGKDFWRWTPAGARFVFLKHFNERSLEVRGYGNVLAGVGFWTGMSQKDIKKIKLQHWDPNFPVIVSVKVTI